MQFEELAKQFALKNLPESEVELSGEVPFAVVAPYQKRALTHIAEHLEVAGFRPGKVPADMALKKVGEVAVLEEAVELFVKDFFPELILARRLDAVGRPDIRVTKLAPENPVGLLVRATVYPELKVNAGWKTLHTQVVLEPSLPATEEEVQKTLEDLQKSRASQEPTPEGSAKDGPLELPPLDDVFAKSLGAFESLAALQEQVKKGIGEEKQRVARDARRSRSLGKLC